MIQWFFFLYFVVGFIYYLINIFVRKLHTKNEPGDGWFLVPLWIFGWPFCLAALVASMFDNKHV